MKRGQIFKRLMAITEDELILFLDFVDDISKALLKLDIAARTPEFDTKWRKLLIHIGPASSLPLQKAQLGVLRRFSDVQSL